MAEVLLPTDPVPGDYDHEGLDEEQRRKAAEASLRADRLAQVEAAIVGTVGGREWLWGLLGSLHCFEDRISLSGDMYEQGRLNGERDVGQRFLRRFAKVSPQNFAQMFVENDR